MRPAKIVAIVIGVLLIIIGLALLVPGAILLWLNGTADSQGYLNTPTHALQSSGSALITPDIKLQLGSGDWIPGDWSIQIKATSKNGAPLFLGIAPTSDVANYLSGVPYDEVTNIGWFSSGNVEYSAHPGTPGSTPPPPGQQTFWAAQQSGTGTQTLQWHIQSGNWTAVLMNADGSAGVSADVRLGAHLGFLLPLGIGLTIGGLVLLAGGIVLVVLGARRSRPPAQPLYGQQGPYGPQPPYGSQPPYGQPPRGQQPYGPQPPPYQPPQPPPYQPPQAPPYQEPPATHSPQGYPTPTPPPPVAPPEQRTPPGPAPERPPSDS